MSWFLRTHSYRFRRGLVIQSGTLAVFRRCLPRLRTAFEDCELDLLTCYPRATEEFSVFRRVWDVTEVHGSSAKLRLLLSLRKQYDLLVVLTSNEPVMRRWRLAGLLLLRPEKAFAFNENGDGYWLDWPSRGLIWRHILWRINRARLSPVRLVAGSVLRVVLAPLVYLYLLGFVMASYARRTLRRGSRSA